MLTQTLTRHEFSNPRLCLTNGNTLRTAALPSLADRQEEPDEALVKSLAEGDNNALQALFARHNVRVYRFALRVTGNPSTAEDIVNEVFFDVWRLAAGFEG